MDLLVLEHRRHPLGGCEGFDAGGCGFDGDRAQHVRAVGQSLSIETAQDVVHVAQGAVRGPARGLDGRLSLAPTLALAGSVLDVGAEKQDRLDPLPRAEAIQS